MSSQPTSRRSSRHSQVGPSTATAKRNRDEGQETDSPRKAARNSEQHSEAQGEAMTAEEVLSSVTMEDLTTMKVEVTEKVHELQKQYEEAASRLARLQEFSQLKEKHSECQAAKHAAEEAKWRSDVKSAEFDRLLTTVNTEEWKVILPAKEKRVEEEEDDLYASN